MHRLSLWHNVECSHNPFPIGLNLVAFIIIVFAYTSMFYSVHTTAAKAVERSVFSMEVAIAKRFFFIVFTDALCWIPIFLLKLFSLLQVEIPGDRASSGWPKLLSLHTQRQEHTMLVVAPCC